MSFLSETRRRFAHFLRGAIEIGSRHSLVENHRSAITHGTGVSNVEVPVEIARIVGSGQVTIPALAGQVQKQYPIDSACPVNCRSRPCKKLVKPMDSPLAERYKGTRHFSPMNNFCTLGAQLREKATAADRDFKSGLLDFFSGVKKDDARRQQLEALGVEQREAGDAFLRHYRACITCRESAPAQRMRRA